MNIQGNQIIGELVAQDYRAATVFKNHGIDFCCQGNRTISEACETDNAVLESVLTDLNNASKTVEGKATDYQSWPLDLLADYISKTHHRYVRQKGPEILPYLEKICRVHGGHHPELHVVLEHFKETVKEMAEHMEEEESYVFPLIKDIEKAAETGEISESLKETTLGSPIQKMMDEHLAEGDRFREIEKLTNGYTNPPDGCNTYHVTLQLLKEFEADLHLHIHLENNILFPRAIELEQKLN